MVATPWGTEDEEIKLPLPHFQTPAPLLRIKNIKKFILSLHRPENVAWGRILISNFCLPRSFTFIISQSSSSIICRVTWTECQTFTCVLMIRILLQYDRRAWLGLQTYLYLLLYPWLIYCSGISGLTSLKGVNTTFMKGERIKKLVCRHVYKKTHSNGSPNHLRRLSTGVLKIRGR